MIKLDKEVFGKITTKEIIGADPPAVPDTQNILKKELVTLSVELKLLSKKELENLLEQQKIAKKHVNSRPGAMALAQNKIQLFNEYNDKYMKMIQERLNS